MAPATETIRESQRQRMATRRAAERNVQIPKPVDPKRRKRAMGDLFFFLTAYFPEVFYQDFTPSRREMAMAIAHAAEYGGDQAISAERGGGKTRLALYTCLWLVLQGKVKFPLIIAKNQKVAERELKSIKARLEAKGSTLSEDFPEVCVPIIALERWASKARLQAAYLEGEEPEDAEPTLMEWARDHIILPAVKGSKCGGSVIACLGIEGPIRGYSMLDRRPDLVIIDDVDDRESANSPTQTQTREEIIDQDIAGLAGPGRSVARVMLCTIINATCVAATYTDPAKKSSWRGKRFKFLIKEPERQDLWQKYMELRSDAGEDDPDARKAHQFYLDHREEMDEGGEVSNPARFDSGELVDGTPAEVSALQHAYNRICDIGPEKFAAEYQSEVDESLVIEEAGLQWATIAFKRTNGYAQRVVPIESRAVTAFVDLGLSKGCHWSACGWQDGFTGVVADYGVQEVHNHKKIGEGRAVVKALHAWREEMFAHPIVDDNGEVRPFDLVLIDVGNGQWAKEVWAFVSEAGKPFRCSQGFGSGHGRSPFRRAKQRTREYLPGDNYYQKFLAEQRQWLIGMNVDYWKQFVHQRLVTDPRDDEGRLRRGSLSLYEPTRPGEHHSFAHHLMAEEFRPRMTAKGEVMELVVHSRNNDWLDTVVGNCVAARMKGVKLVDDGVRNRAVVRKSVAPAKQGGSAPKKRRSFTQSWRGRF